jgi:HAD superfamily hydrolase (TIGR01450 family)
VTARADIDALVARYEALLLDALGVLVAEGAALPGAPELVTRLNATGKPYLVVTNDASKLPEAASARFRTLGLDIGPERILSSGMLLAPHFAAHDLAGSRVAVLGPPGSVRYVELAGGVPVAWDDCFDALVIGDESGFPFLEGVDAALSSLFRILDSGGGVHLVVPNPDLVYPRAGGDFGIAAGSMALMFEAALALRYPERADLAFVRLGKPYPAIFEEALARLGTRNALMIGDQLETDVRGALACGIDAALVAGGVSRYDPAAVPADRQPTWLLASLVADEGAGGH